MLVAFVLAGCLLFIAQVGLKLLVFLLQLPNRWDYGHASLCLAWTVHFKHVLWSITSFDIIYIHMDLNNIKTYILESAPSFTRSRNLGKKSNFSAQKLFYLWPQRTLVKRKGWCIWKLSSTNYYYWLFKYFISFNNYFIFYYKSYYVSIFYWQDWDQWPLAENHDNFRSCSK